MADTNPRPQDREDGASAVEYGLLVAGVAGVVAAAVFLFGGAVQGLFNDTCYAVSNAGSTTSTAMSC